MDHEFGVAIPKKPLTVRLIETIGILLVLSILFSISYFIIFKIKNKEVVISGPESISVTMSNNDTIEALSEKWLNTYLEQYKQSFISYKKKIDSVNIEKTYVLERGKYKIIQIDFDIKAKSRLSRYYLTWGTYDENTKTVKCQWVVWFTSKRNSTGEVIYSCYKTQTPSGYRINKEKERGISNQVATTTDDRQPLGVNGSISECAYIIEGDKMSVSYNYGTSWSEVPVSIEELFGSELYKTIDARLPEKSYVINKEITAFVYGGNGDENLLCLYSHDMGLNWSISTISKDIDDLRLRSCDFLNNQLGYVVVSYKSGSWQETQEVYKTTNGGETWSKTGTGPRQTKMFDASFVYSDTGFLCYEHSDYYTINLYYTNDGGARFRPVSLPVKDEWKNIFVQPQAPYIKGDKLYLKIEQGENSDYLGGEAKALYVSGNLGKTWTFEGLIDSK